MIDIKKKIEIINYKFVEYLEWLCCDEFDKISSSFTIHIYYKLGVGSPFDENGNIKSQFDRDKGANGTIFLGFSENPLEVNKYVSDNNLMTAFKNKCPFANFDLQFHSNKDQYTYISNIEPFQSCNVVYNVRFIKQVDKDFQNNFFNRLLDKFNLYRQDYFFFTRMGGDIEGKVDIGTFNISIIE